MSSDAEREPQAIALPAPTHWPMFAALGVTLIFAGLLMHVLVSVVGAAFLVAGVVGWFREVLPVEHVEQVPLRPPALRARPVTTAARARTLLPGEDGHRLALPVEVHPYSSGLAGGLAGAVAMAVVACAYGLIAHGSLWYPINLLAAVAMPSLAAADTAALRAFIPAAFALGAVAHLVTSLFVGLVYAAVLPMLPRFSALWGGLVAPLVWSGLLWATFGVINPLLNARIDWPWFVASQIAFGLAAGAVISRSQRIRTLQAVPLAARAGIEAPGLTHEKEEA